MMPCEGYYTPAGFRMTEPPATQGHPVASLPLHILIGYSKLPGSDELASDHPRGYQSPGYLPGPDGCEGRSRCRGTHNQVASCSC